MPARIHTDWPMFLAILAILAFGLVMLGLAWRATQKEKQKP